MKKLHPYDHIWELPLQLPKTIKQLFLRKDYSPKRNLRIRLLTSSYLAKLCSYRYCQSSSSTEQNWLSTIDLLWNVLFHINTCFSPFGKALTQWHRLGDLRTTENDFSPFWRLEDWDQDGLRWSGEGSLLGYKGPTSLWVSHGGKTEEDFRDS